MRYDYRLTHESRWICAHFSPIDIGRGFLHGSYFAARNLPLPELAQIAMPFSANIRCISRCASAPPDASRIMRMAKTVFASHTVCANRKWSLQGCNALPLSFDPARAVARAPANSQSVQDADGARCDKRNGHKRYA
jgi:hypothetical protein